MADSAAVSEIRDLLRRYVEWFSAGAADRIAREAYLAPFTAFLPTGALTLPTPEAIQAGVAASLKPLRDAGYARSAMGELTISVLHDRAAIASGLMTRHRADGSIMETIGATYLVSKSADGWRIAAIIAHDPRTVVGTVVSS